MFYQIELPSVSAFLNLSFVIPTFVEKPRAPVDSQGCGEAEQLGKRRQRARCDDLRCGQTA